MTSETPPGVDLHRATGEFFSVVVGLFSFVALAAMSLGIISEWVITKELQKQQSVLHKAEAVSRDVGTLLDQLAQDGSTSCDRANLVQLKRLLFEHQFALDIGMYNSEGLLYCTTNMGVLSKPLRQSSTPYLTSHGFEIWLDAPALIFNGAIKITVVRLGYFDAVISPAAIREILDSYRGIIWFDRPGLIPMKVNYPFSPERLVRMSECARELGPGVHFRWRNFGIVVISRVSHSPYVFDGNILLENYLTLTDILQNSPLLTIIAMIVSMLIGILVSVALSPRLLKYQAIKFKVKYLCTEEHIHCMYQPIIDLKTNAVVGCEVLMRLFDEDGTYFPDQVIPTIIESGLTWQLDKAVTSKALEEIGTHFKDIDGFKVAFNFFPDDLKDFERIHEHFQALHAKNKTSRFSINIEITEHGFSGDDIQSQVNQYKRAGYLISVDDFGTGYSNLGIISKIAPDFLKIDKSFVFDMEDISVRSSLIPEIISIAHTVHAEVIAEGIENKKQESKLRILGANYGQGYYYAKPMPISAFLSFYLERHGTFTPP